MTKRRVIIVTVLLGLAVAAFFIFYDDGGPSYKGRSLREWVQMQNLSATRIVLGIKITHEEWVKAIRHYDTNAIPYLLEWVQIDRPSWSTYISAILGNICDRLGINWAPPLDKESKLSTGAVHAFYVLGPRAESAIPELVKIIQAQSQNTNYAAASQVEHRIIDALAGIGPTALPAFITAYTNVFLEHKNQILARMQDMGTNARPAVPWLLSQTIAHYDELLAMRAWEILKNFGMDVVLRDLSAGITNSNASMRFEQVQVAELFDFVNGGQQLLPALRQVLATETNVPIRNHASNALYQIEKSLKPGKP